ncbi:iron-binding protein [Naganishia vaughanmartiniae]|uniref:Iron-binding protein n=1 Tax=Naganishia vaughanmartiniae TaxID=1424756 RepID=A0ACC2XB86_9TREE|nr:iron-binding protein [Naganishia vaughanmartiniae]
MYRSALTQSANVLRRSSVVATPRIASRFAAARPSASVLGSVASKRSYHEKVIDHYENPRNVGSFNKKDLDVGTGLVGAPACGDVMKLQIKVDDNGVIQQAVFKTFGCGSAIASSSFATELIRGMTLDQAAQVTNKTISQELALPPVKLHCSMLAEDAITSAIKDYRSKRSKAPSMQPPAASATQQTATA